ncbi:MAG: hypothetical protein KF744_05485 [Taibaiella sp.]|nr:hypothetical protein [Taibaiella sp.]
MKYTVLFYTLITVYLCSCGSVGKKMRFDDINDTTDIFNPEVANHLKSSQLFSFDSIIKISAFEKSVEAIYDVNFDDSTEVDTIIKFANLSDTIIYAKANSGLFLWKMSLQSSLFILDRDIFVSCKKQVFRSKCLIDTVYNILSVSGEDAAETFYFTFDNDSLKRIEYVMHFEAVN